MSAARMTVLAAVADAVATGLVLLASPPLFAWLVLGAEPSDDTGQVLGRIAGAAMLATGLATWPASAAASPPASAVRALLVFNVIATIYLTYLGLAGRFFGILLWPAVAVHAALSILLGRAWLAATKK